MLPRAGKFNKAARVTTGWELTWSFILASSEALPRIDQDPRCTRSIAAKDCTKLYANLHFKGLVNGLVQEHG